MTFQVFTIGEAAKLARCSARLLSTNIRTGHLAATRLGGHKIVVRSDALEAWLRSCTTPVQQAA